MLRAGLIFLLTACSLVSYGWNFNGLLGAESGGLAGTGVVRPGVWSAENNAAGLASLDNPVLGMHYENRFLVKGLGFGGFTFATPLKSGGVGLTFSSFGSNLYRESKVGLAYGQRLSDKFNMGVQLAYLQTYIGNDYGVRHSVAASLGATAKLTDKITFGMNIFNLNRAKLDDYNDERIPTIVRAGGAFELSDKVVAIAELEKEIGEKTIVKAALDYHPVDIFYFRAGIATNPYNYTVGFGLELDNFNLNVATGFHPVLGPSPMLSLVYTISKK